MTWITTWWRGQLGLARVFWLHSAVAALAVFILGSAIFSLHQARSVILGTLLIAVFFMAFAVIQSVGVWRSAGSYPGPKVWAFSARAVVVLTATLALLVGLSVAISILALLHGLTHTLHSRPQSIDNRTSHVAIDRLTKAAISFRHYLRREIRISRLVAGALGTQVPNPNLVPNPGFEFGESNTFDDWTYYQNSGTGSMSVATAPQPVYAGSRAAMLSVTSPGDLGIHTPEPGVIPVVPNTAYTFTAEMRTSGALQHTCARIIEWHTGSNIATNDTTLGCSHNTAWTLFQARFTTLPATNAVSIRLMGRRASGTFYWDAISLVRTDTQAIYVTPAPTGACRPTHGCLIASWSASDRQVQYVSGNTIDLNAELDRWAAIYQDVRGGGVCAPAATQALYDRLTNALNAGPISDQRPSGDSVDYFRQFLAGGIVTHIFAAAKEIDYHSIPNSLEPLLAQVKARFGGDPKQNYTNQIPSPQDSGCGLGSLPRVNSCMDDHSLTASGYAWLAAYEYQRLRSPQPFLGRAFNEIDYAMAPMSNHSDPSTHGGGPCVESVTTGSPHCSGTAANYTPAGYRIIGADHDQENPNYGLGLMTGIASACAAIYDAGSTCGGLSAWNVTAATELLRTAQQRASHDGSDWDQGGCPVFYGGTAPCDDHTHFALSANAAYKPRDFSLALFYSLHGIPAGYPPDAAYQFGSYCEPRTVWSPPYESLWGPNRYTFYATYSNDLFEADTQAPRVSIKFPTAGLVLTGTVAFGVDSADDNRVNHVAYYLNGRGSPFDTASWPFTAYVDTSAGNIDGSYTLVAKAFDDPGNVGTSGTVPFTVSNPRLNAGGTGFVDQYGNHWFADYGYDTGYTASTEASVRGTDLPRLYQTVRWYPGVLTYTLPVANGTRTVKLRFAEFVYTYRGARYFNVLINGTQVLTNFDVVAAAGGAFIAVDRSFVTTVTNQQVTITFVPVHESPEISAIEIH